MLRLDDLALEPSRLEGRQDGLDEGEELRIVDDRPLVLPIEHRIDLGLAQLHNKSPARVIHGLPHRTSPSRRKQTPDRVSPPAFLLGGAQPVRQSRAGADVPSCRAPEATIRSGAIPSL